MVKIFHDWPRDLTLDMNGTDLNLLMIHGSFMKNGLVGKANKRQ